MYKHIQTSVDVCTFWRGGVLPLQLIIRVLINRPFDEQIYPKIFGFVQQQKFESKYFFRPLKQTLLTADEDEVVSRSCFPRMWLQTPGMLSHCCFGRISQSSNLQTTTISNRPLCILIYSLASNIGHQQLCKGRSPTEKHARQSQINHLNKCDLHLIASNLNNKSCVLRFIPLLFGWWFSVGPRSSREFRAEK